MSAGWLLLAGGLIAAFATLVAVGLVSVRTPPVEEGALLVRLAGEEFRLEIAATPEGRARGLAGRTELGANEGMLFRFDITAPHSFWMKGMRIPIDIVWLSGGVIRAVTAGIEPPPPGIPDAELPRFTSPEPVDSVIEIRAGRASELGLGIGQRVKILLP
ncbi:MAG: DUF192 domain-containing protein [Candidatus Sungbacteria bacterium]|uniref:DUF192 domain-containing protein n=1 Tax=Candidatus Sungiibacteriota bacterium TaxID=2750080 RepID=A0A933DSY5_9BACT|nr:DUF192 domain-containing protein [Candidatus Sungbacteria bacterium]